MRLWLLSLLCCYGCCARDPAVRLPQLCGCPCYAAASPVLFLLLCCLADLLYGCPCCACASVLCCCVAESAVAAPLCYCSTVLLSPLCFAFPTILLSTEETSWRGEGRDGRGGGGERRKETEMEEHKVDNEDEREGEGREGRAARI